MPGQLLAHLERDAVHGAGRDVGQGRHGRWGWHECHRLLRLLRLRVLHKRHRMALQLCQRCRLLRLLRQLRQLRRWRCMRKHLCLHRLLLQVLGGWVLVQCIGLQATTAAAEQLM